MFIDYIYAKGYKTDKTIARYSVLHESDQLFASKYMAYMPTEEELRQEIEQQKQFFLAQHGSEDSSKDAIGIEQW